MRQSPTYDKEKVTQSIATLRAHGHDFEIVIDAEFAMKFRRGEAEIHDALKSPHIYKEVKTGELASEELMQEIFRTSDERKVAEKIILEGELHFNDEYKEQLRAEKKKQLIEILTREAAELNSGMPVSEKRLTSALSQANVHLDLYRSVKEQMADVLAKLKPVLALTLESRTISLRIPSKYAPKLYGFVSSKSRILQEAWLGDGSLSARVEVPAGFVSGFVDELKKSTHGDAEVNIEAQKKKQ